MTATRPKDIGTRAETAVLKQLLPYFPEARREVLHGNKDWGDILADSRFIFEVKGGHQAWVSHPGDIERWVTEAAVEAGNAGRAHGILVVQRKGYSSERAWRWFVHVPFGQLALLLGSASEQDGIVRLELGDFLQMLTEQGYTEV